MFEQPKSTGSCFFWWRGAVGVSKFNHWYQKKCWAGSVIWCSSDCCLLTSEMGTRLRATEAKSVPEIPDLRPPCESSCLNSLNGHSSREGANLPRLPQTGPYPGERSNQSFGSLQTVMIHFWNESLHRRPVNGTSVSLLTLHFIERV